jgi:hypothetical protein
MPVTSRSIARTTLARALAFSVCLGAAAIAPACAVFDSGPSLVAQGRYYSSGNPQYDEFFIQLYQLQLQMADAPAIPDNERQALAQALELSAETPADGITQRLREEALKLGKTGLRMRLEQSPSLDKPEAASATIRASYRPKESAPATLFAKIEASASNLLRTASAMKAAEVELGKLEVAVITLDADVPQAFAEARVGTQGEVKKNLADAQKLITLMKARGSEVNDQCEALLSGIAKAVDTDDGSLSAPPESPEPKATDADPKKAAPKSRAKPKPTTPTPPASAPTVLKPAPAKSAPAQPPKPVAADDEAPAKPAAPSKPAPPPRDFEP